MLCCARPSLERGDVGSQERQVRPRPAGAVLQGRRRGQSSRIPAMMTASSPLVITADPSERTHRPPPIPRSPLVARVRADRTAVDVSIVLAGFRHRVVVRRMPPKKSDFGAALFVNLMVKARLVRFLVYAINGTCPPFIALTQGAFQDAPRMRLNRSAISPPGKNTARSSRQRSSAASNSPGSQLPSFQSSSTTHSTPCTRRPPSLATRRSSRSPVRTVTEITLLRAKRPKRWETGCARVQLTTLYPSLSLARYRYSDIVSTQSKNSRLQRA